MKFYMVQYSYAQEKKKKDFSLGRCFKFLQLSLPMLASSVTLSLLKTEVRVPAFCMGLAGFCSPGFLGGGLGVMLQVTRL